MTGAAAHFIASILDKAGVKRIYGVALFHPQATKKSFVLSQKNVLRKAPGRAAFPSGDGAQPLARLPS
jgi:hypothetical protein